MTKYWLIKLTWRLYSSQYVRIGQRTDIVAHVFFNTWQCFYFTMMNEDLIRTYVRDENVDQLIYLFNHLHDNMIRAEAQARGYLIEIVRLKSEPKSEPISTPSMAKAVIPSHKPKAKAEELVL
jgi:hypothetical protein